MTVNGHDFYLQIDSEQFVNRSNLPRTGSRISIWLKMITAIVAVSVVGNIAIPLSRLSLVAAGAISTSSNLLPFVKQVENWVAAGVGVKQLPSALNGQLANEESSIFDNNPCREMPGSSSAATFCTFGDKKAWPYLVLYGDSLAQMWIPALDQLGKQFHFRVLAAVRYGCTIASVVVINYTGTVDPGCAPFRHNVLAKISGFKELPQVVIFSQWEPSPWMQATTASGHTLTASEWARGVRTTLTTIHQPSIVEVLLLGVPVARYDPEACLSSHTTDVYVCNTSVIDGFQGSRGPADATTATLASAYPVKLNKLMCTSVQCPAVVHSMFTHANPIHVNLYYSRALASALGELLGCVGARVAAKSLVIGSILQRLGGTNVTTERLKICASAGG